MARERGLSRRLAAIGSVVGLTAGLLPALDLVVSAPMAYADVSAVSPSTAANTGQVNVTFTSTGSYLLAPSSITITRSGSSDAPISASNVGIDSSSSSKVDGTFNLTAAAPGSYDVAVSPGAPGLPLSPDDTCTACFTVTGGTPKVTKVNNGSAVSATGGNRTIPVVGTNLANHATVTVLKGAVPDPDITAAVGTLNSTTTGSVTLSFPHDDAESGLRTLIWQNTDNKVGSCTCLTITGSVAGSAPDAPTSVHADAGNRSAMVSWIPGDDNNNVVTGYTVTSSPDGVKTHVGPTVHSALVKGLRNGTTYKFNVVETNGKGNSLPGVSNGVKPHAPKVTVTMPSTVVPGGGPADFTIDVSNDTITAYPKARLDITITGLPGLRSSRMTLLDTNSDPGTPMTLTDDQGSVVAHLPENGKTFPLGGKNDLNNTFHRPFSLSLDPATPSGTLLVIATLVDTSTTPATPVSTSSGDAKVPGSTTRYVPVTPLRFVDTHNGVGLSKGRHSGSSVITIPSTVPASAHAVVLDVTVADPSRTGSLRVYPMGGPTANRAVSFKAGHDQSQVTVTAFSPRHRVTLNLSSGSAHFVVSLLGYESDDGTSGGRFVPVSQRRLSDTRGGAQPDHRTVTVSIPTSVPKNAAAVMLDVTAVNTHSAGTVKVFPAGGSAPIAVAVNFVKGASHTSAFLTKMSSTRKVAVLIQGKGDVTVDLVGYFDRKSSYVGRYRPIAPTLIVNGTKSGTVIATMPAAVPGSATAAFMTVTSHGPGSSGFLRAYAAGANEPVTTALSWAAHADASNLVAVPLGQGRQVSFDVHGGSTRLQVEVIGFLTG